MGKQEMRAIERAAADLAARATKLAADVSAAAKADASAAVGLYEAAIDKVNQILKNAKAAPQALVQIRGTLDVLAQQLKDIPPPTPPPNDDNGWDPVDNGDGGSPPVV